MRSTPSSQRAFVVFVAAVVLSSAAGARAGEPTPAEADAPEKMVDPEARRLFDSGLRYFNVGNYPAAIQDFEAAYHRSPVAGLLYNLAQAHRLAGECAPALVLYRRYLASDPGGKSRARTEARISDMESCVAASRSKVDHPDEEAGAGPAEPAVGAPSLRAAPPAAVVNPALIAPAAPASGSHRRRTYALATGGTAVALGAVSGYFGWKAVQAASQTSVGSWPQPWNARAAGIESTGLRDERIAIGTGIAALVAAGVTAWLFLTD